MTELGDALTTAAMRVELSELLRLADAHISVNAIRLLGNGPSAQVEIDLSIGLTIVSEHFGDLWTAQGLAKFVTQNTGIDAGAINKQQATKANALIRKLAEVTREARIADLGRDHGLAFLRWAPVEPFFLHDQADRYRAFALVDACDPTTAGWLKTLHRMQRPAELSFVLQDRASAVRYVHCGHLFTDVHRRNEVSHPRELADQMTKAGWERSGKRGRIKATPIGGMSPPIVLPLWAVPKGWDDGDGDESEEPAQL
jgi:hypothetical protein